MQVPFPLLQVVLVPAIFVPIVYFTGRKIGENVGWIAFAPLAYTTFLLFLVGLKILLGGTSVYEEFVWVPIAGFKFGLLADGLSLPIVATVSLLCMLMTIYSIVYMEHRIYEEYKASNYPAHATYYALYLLYAVGMMGTALATNLIEFYLFYELMLVPSWALINSYGYGEREKIGLMYFLWTHAGAISLFVGIATAYAMTGSFEIAELALLRENPISTWIAIAMLLGFFVKMAMFGLHIWLPYAHAEAPTPISALLSPAMIGLGAYASVRLVLIPLIDVFKPLNVPLAILALVTMVYGAFMALTQDDIKRLLAYSSISQMGYLLLGISSVTTLGVSGAMFHYVSHGLSKCILFAVAGILICQVHGIRSITRLGGLATRMPITATVFILGFLGIAGIPPTAGFPSKVLLFAGVFSVAVAGSFLELLIAILAIIAPLFTVAYALLTIRYVFFGRLPDHLKDVREAPPIMTIPLLILASMSLLLGTYPRLIVDPLARTISEFLM